MKLHHLRLRGIGPFAGTVDIDFAALSASGMFLLEGPTGSGKSTILDAIVYGLYGQVAGQATSADRIRSQFAAPTEASVVDLIVETASGIFRVRRQPEFQRPKLRGSGTTKEQARAVLWRIGSPQALPAVIADDAGGGAGVEVVASRIDEVGREIQRAVGLTRDQFTQTVLLPQNEFSRFLRADTKERQQVLQRVFGTEIYAGVEKQLEEMRKSAKREVDAATQTLLTALARFTEATAVEDEETATLQKHASALRLEPLAQRADHQLAAVTAQAGAAAQAQQDAQAREQQTAAAAEAARTAVARIDRRRELNALAARLRESESTVRAARQSLQRDRTARPVVELLRRRDTASAQATTAIEALAERAASTRPAHPDLVDLLEHREGDDTAAEALAEAAEEATTAAGALADLVALEAALPERERALAARREALEESRTAQRTLAEQLEQRPSQREELVAARDAARTTAATVADARLAQQAAEEKHRAVTAATAQQATVETARTATADALATARQRSEQEISLRRRRFAGIAAELAADLAPGEACAVCGALDHPHPADPAEDAVTPEQVEAAEAARRDAESAHSRAEQAHALALQELERLRETAGELTAEQAAAALETARAAVAAARAAEDTATALEAKIVAHDAETEQLTRRREAEALAVERERTAIEEAARTLEADRDRLTAARGEDSSIQERRRGHTARARAATALREALRTRDQDEARAAELTQEAADALAAAELATAEEARAAVLEDAEHRRLEQLVRTRAVEESRLGDGLAEEGIAEAPATEEARTEAAARRETAEETLAAARAAAREADGIAARQGAIAERGTAARTALAAAADQVRDVGERAGVVVRVADLATGRSADGQRIQLSTFVLMWRLDAVITAANARLALFSGSDLELQRDPGARGAKKTGLDLLILDRRTDQVRVPETLSGGETFFVSLALALGLADIVAGEAGGVAMETLFIDEGFGSLDPETLETVVREIGHLAQNGRAIGIVSHVGDMKAQIAEQIHVRRGADERSTLTITA
ncbi:AAA family ATPase [Brachybacterium sp. YJGR34]|uniref:AAA family ATPase n=1 Tax=Brachybacterium sp. YJGR34 TaxID=2059911 RepID=UPI000E0B9753|nr:SMC family ATPase [Brachybacterium sp. YJGR34]